jgi:hypothetical protein
VLRFYGLHNGYLHGIGRGSNRLRRMIMIPFPPTLLVLLQWLVHLLYPILRNDHHLQPISDFNMPLHCASEGIPYQSLDILPWQRVRFSRLQLVTRLSRNGMIKLAAAPAALHCSLSYEPTGS